MKHLLNVPLARIYALVNVLNFKFPTVSELGSSRTCISSKLIALAVCYGNDIKVILRANHTIYGFGILLIYSKFLEPLIIN